MWLSPMTFQLGYPSQLTLPSPRKSLWIPSIPDTLFCPRAFAQIVLAFWNTPSASPSLLSGLSLKATLLVMTGLEDQVRAVPTRCYGSRHPIFVCTYSFLLESFYTSPYRLCDLCLEGIFYPSPL